MICFHKWKYGEKYRVEKSYYYSPLAAYLAKSDPIKYLEYRQDKKCIKCGKIKVMTLDK